MKPAGCDSCGRPRDAAASDHRNDSEVAGRSRRRAVHRPSARLAPPAGRQRASCCASAISASRSRPSSATAALWAGGLLFDGRPEFLGTGGALRRALPQLGDAFFVLYGDTYLPIDFAAVEARLSGQRQAALMTVLRNEDRWDTSNVLFVEDNVIVEYNKHAPRPTCRHIDYGLGPCAAQVLAELSRRTGVRSGRCLSPTVAARTTGGYEVHERFYEIGSPAGLEGSSELISKWRTSS